MWKAMWWAYTIYPSSPSYVSYINVTLSGYHSQQYPLNFDGLIFGYPPNHRGSSSLLRVPNIQVKKWHVARGYNLKFVYTNIFQSSSLFCFFFFFAYIFLAIHSVEGGVRSVTKYQRGRFLNIWRIFLASSNGLQQCSLPVTTTSGKHANLTAFDCIIEFEENYRGYYIDWRHTSSSIFDYARFGNFGWNHKYK